MSSSTFNTSSFNETKEFKLDKFANSGQIYNLEINTPSEIQSTHILKQIINKAVNLSEAKKTNASSETKTENNTDSKETKESKEKRPLTFYVLGCGESNTDNKKLIAEFLDEIASKKIKPDFIVLLGDNFESSGIDSNISKSFAEGFHDVYHAKKLEWLANTPVFVIAGNHDHGFPIRKFFKLVTGVNNDLSKIAHEIAHTYVDEKGSESKEKISLFSNDTLYLSQMRLTKQPWNMPGRYYGLKYDNAELFFIDSNTYVKEYIEFFLNDKKSLNGQPAWLEIVSKNPDRLKLLFMHHPLHTIGKRSGFCDLGDYLSKEDIEKLKAANIIKPNEDVATLNYNKILLRIFKKQGLKFDAVIAAHDHSVYHGVYPNDDNPDEINDVFTQVVVGGAGGDLQNRFLLKPQTSCFLKQHGFAQIQLSTGKNPQLFFDYYTASNPELLVNSYGFLNAQSKNSTITLLKNFGINGHHLRFAGKDTKPLKESDDEPGVKQLSELINISCKEFIQKTPLSVALYTVPTSNGLEQRALFDSVPIDFVFADELKNHFLRFEANTFLTSINYLRYVFSMLTPNLFSKIYDRVSNFFRSPPQKLTDYILKNLEMTYNISFDQFMNLPIEVLQKMFVTSLDAKDSKTIASTSLASTSVTTKPEQKYENHSITPAIKIPEKKQVILEHKDSARSLISSPGSTPVMVGTDLKSPNQEVKDSKNSSPGVTKVITTKTNIYNGFGTCTDSVVVSISSHFTKNISNSTSEDDIEIAKEAKEAHVTLRS